jgi:hypothetical protein
MNPDNLMTPLELLNLYLTDGKSRGNTSSELYQKFNRELTWDSLLNEGYQQDLAPMLYYIINKYPTLLKGGEGGLLKEIQVSEEIKSKLKALYNQYLVRNMIQFKELDTILDVFEKEGIDVIQLKGAWLAKNYYPDPALRPMEDLDLLLRKKATKRSKECLMRLGYLLAEGATEEAWEKKHFHFPFLKQTNALPILVELHHDIRAKSDFIDSEIKEFWHHSTPVSKEYRHLLKIPMEYLLLHLFAHSYLNFSGSLSLRMLSILDIAFVLKRYQSDIDWILIERRAREWGMQRQVYFCLYMMRSLLDVPLNGDVLQLCKPIYPVSKLFDFVLVRIGDSGHDSEEINTAFIILLNLVAITTVSGACKYLAFLAKYLLGHDSKNPFMNRKVLITKKYGVSSKFAMTTLSLAHPILSIFRGIGLAVKIFSHDTRLKK